MHELIQWCASVRAALASLHPSAPWLALAVFAGVFDALSRRFGFVRYVESTYPWGKVAAEFLSSVPTVIFGALFPLLTSGDADPGSAVKGALASALLPVLLAIRANSPKPPSGGAGLGASMAFALLLTGCGAKPPNFSGDEKHCLAVAEAKSDLRTAACGKNVEGPCSTDSLMDLEEREKLACVGAK
jgi:hypothetical protein